MRPHLHFDGNGREHLFPELGVSFPEPSVYARQCLPRHRYPEKRHKKKKKKRQKISGVNVCVGGWGAQAIQYVVMYVYSIGPLVSKGVRRPKKLQEVYMPPSCSARIRMLA